MPLVLTCVEEAGLQQLLEVADDSNVDQVPDIVCLALAQLLPLHPLAGQHPAGGQLCEGAWDYNLRRQDEG